MIHRHKKAVWKVDGQCPVCTFRLLYRPSKVKDRIRCRGCGSEFTNDLQIVKHREQIQQ